MDNQSSIVDLTIPRSVEIGPSSVSIPTTFLVTAKSSGNTSTAGSDYNLDISDYFAETLHEIDDKERKVINDLPDTSQTNLNTNKNIKSTNSTRFLPKMKKKTSRNEQKNEDISNTVNAKAKDHHPEGETANRFFNDQPSSRRNCETINRNNNYNNFKRQRLCNADVGENRQQQQNSTPALAGDTLQRRRRDNQDNYRNNNRGRFRQDLTARWREVEQIRNEHLHKLRAIEAHEKDLEIRKIEVQEKSQEIQKVSDELEKQKVSMIREMESLKNKLNTQRSDFQSYIEIENKRLEERRVEFENDVEKQRMAMKLQLNNFELSMKKFDLAVQEKEAAIAMRLARVEGQELTLKIGQDELESKVLACNIRENELAMAMKSFELSSAMKMAEQKAWDQKLKRKEMLLTKETSEFRDAKAAYQIEVQQWNREKRLQQDDLQQNMRDFAIFQQQQTKQLDERQKEQSMQQANLDARATSQRRRTVELKELKRELDEKKKILDEKKIASQPARKDAKPAQRSEKPIDYILIDSDDEHEECPTTKEMGKSNSKTTNTRIPTNESYRFDWEKEFNYSYSEETAHELQERLLRESAARMRAQTTAHVSNATTSTTNESIAIKTPMYDIALRFPNHWQWKEPYAILGLPLNATIELVKSQYRRLARTYHPDKSTDPEASTKFHSITSAYHKLADKC